LRLKAHVTNAVAPRTAHVPLYYDGAAVAALFDADAPTANVDIVRM